MNLEFTPENVPDTVSAEPNPFVEGKVFPKDRQDDGTGAISVTLPGTPESNKKDTDKLSKQARDAAKLVDRSCRTKIVTVGTDSKPATKVILWTVPRISRKPAAQNGVTDPTEAAMTPDERAAHDAATAVAAGEPADGPVSA